MNKREINVFDYTQDILNGVKGGVLLTSKAGDEVDTMTISWGTLGIEWGKPIFTTFVRESRYTKGKLDANPEFTVNIPYGSADFDKSILGFCGSKSGRDVNKIEELGLTLVEPEVVSVPAIKELPLTLECRIVYKQQQDLGALGEADVDRWYPVESEGHPAAGKRDVHVAYYGEIVAAYVIED